MSSFHSHPDSSEGFPPVSSEQESPSERPAAPVRRSLLHSHSSPTVSADMKKLMKSSHEPIPHQRAPKLSQLKNEESVVVEGHRRKSSATPIIMNRLQRYQSKLNREWNGSPVTADSPLASSKSTDQPLMTLFDRQTLLEESIQPRNEQDTKNESNSSPDTAQFTQDIPYNSRPYSLSLSMDVSHAPITLDFEEISHVNLSASKGDYIENSNLTVPNMRFLLKDDSRTTMAPELAPLKLQIEPTGQSLYMKHPTVRPLLDYFDPEAPEIIAVKENNKSSLQFKQFLSAWLSPSKDPPSSSVSVQSVRQMYRLKRAAHRDESEDSGYMSKFVWYLFNIRQYRSFITRLLKSEKRIVLFVKSLNTLLDLIVDLCFCFMYLIELQYHQSKGYEDLTQDKSPRWLYVGRQRVLFYIAASLAGLNLLSLVIKLLFADNFRNAFWRLDSMLTMIISVPFIVLTRVDGGRHIFIPYFLRSLVLIPNLKSVLRLRSYVPRLNFNAYKEKTIVLIATMLTIIYTGVCMFNFAETRGFRQVAGKNAESLSLLDTIYFIMITISTVGYGDITPSTQLGQITIMGMILVALTIIPGLVSDVTDNFRLQQRGGGSYSRGTSPYVVVCGEFQTVARVKDVLVTLFSRKTKKKLKVIFLARNELLPEVKAFMNQPLYRNRAVYLVGSGLDWDDMKRVDLRHGSAAFIMASHATTDRKIEDEQNTLRAWAFDEFAPMTPLYVDNLLSETETLHEKTTTATVCVEELKQILLAYNCLYRGVGNLLITLLYNVKTYVDYTDPWRAQYGDGAMNEIYQTPVNPVFAGHSFSEVSRYLFREFQVILFGLLVYLPSNDRHHVVLNPGSNYLIKENDRFLFIAGAQEDLQAISDLTQEQFAKSFMSKPFSQSSAQTNPRKPMDQDHSFDQKSPTRPDSAFGGNVLYGYPVPPQTSEKVPLCLLLMKPMKSISEVLIEDASHVEHHILVCTRSFDLLRFVCTLRSANLSIVELKPIVFLCPTLPTEEEFKQLAVFPELFFMVGDPQNRAHLEMANIRGADKVVIMNMQTPGKEAGLDGDFADSSAIMVASLVYNMFHRSGVRKYTVMELQRRGNIRFLRPTGRQKVPKKKKESLLSTRRNVQLTPDRDWTEDVFFSPVFAAGRVLSSSMLETMLFQAYHNPFILDIFNAFCGVKYRRDLEIDRMLPIEKSVLCYVSLPPEFMNKTFGSLYESLAKSFGIIALGLLRDEIDPELGNKLPFVYTNPPYSLLLKSTDLVYVLAANSVLKG